MDGVLTMALVVACVIAIFALNSGHQKFMISALLDAFDDDASTNITDSSRQHYFQRCCCRPRCCPTGASATITLMLFMLT
jgi:hypothetical protein